MSVNKQYTFVFPQETILNEESIESLKAHMFFSEALMNLHKHGNEIQNSLLFYKGKKSLRSEENKSIYKLIFDSCNYASGSLMNDLMTHLDGLIFSHVPELMDKAFFLECNPNVPVYLTSIYYARAKWMLSYYDEHHKIIFDTGEKMSEEDIAYILNYVLVYNKHLDTIEIFLSTHTDDLYDSRDKARKVINKLRRHLQNGFQLLHTMLQECLDRLQPWDQTK